MFSLAPVERNPLRQAVLALLAGCCASLEVTRSAIFRDVIECTALTFV